MLPVEVLGNADDSKNAEAASYPFKKYRMWFESFELRKPTRPAAGGQAGLIMGSE